MAVIIGSARIDENGHAVGGAAGDQKQKSTPDYGGEISMQNFYVPRNKGWYILRPKSAEHAKKIAKKMETACNNKNIGYDQGGRYGVVKNGVATKTKTEADCSSLVRACVKEATGKDPGDFNTESEPKALEKTGLFEKKISYTSGTTLYTGDVLVTKTKGHTAIVVKGASRSGNNTPTTKKTSNSKVALPTLKIGNEGEEVKKLQKNLKSLGFRDDSKEELEVDGKFGSKTKQALIKFQKSAKIEPDGVYGKESHEAMKSIIN